ncbi:MAG: replicative DNA helicase [Thermoguttaceae bacterium]|nr:replicative DNA helicase [Thermoguttaceae bacterium]
MTKQKYNNRYDKKSEQVEISALFDRLPPTNPEAEKNVVGGIILRPEICDDVAMVVRPDDFYSEPLKRIYQQLINMKNSGMGIDLLLLVEQLRASGELEEIGGESFIADLLQNVQIAAHAVHYAAIVREQAIRRDMIEASAMVLRDAFSPEVPARELLGEAELRILGVGDRRSSNQVENLDEVLKDITVRLSEGNSLNADCVQTGFRGLDKLLGGLHPSELIILAARPSMGKTALATNIADYVAVECRQPVLFVSLEMSKHDLAIRLLSARAKIKGEKFRNAFLSSDEWTRLSTATSALGDAPIYIDDSTTRNVTEINAVARRLHRQEGLGLIVIDYLGLIQTDNPNDPNRQEQVAKCSRRLKAMARELKVPVLCLAQLNRETEKDSKQKRPRLSHLRESGAIEQDADVVMFVHREEYYQDKNQAQDNNTQNNAVVIVAKQRNGPTGDVQLYWQGEYTLFSNYRQDDGSDEAHADFNGYGGDGVVNQF